MDILLFFLSLLNGSNVSDSVRLVTDSLSPEYFSLFFSLFDLQSYNILVK